MLSSLTTVIICKAEGWRMGDTGEALSRPLFILFRQEKPGGQISMLVNRDT